MKGKLYIVSVPIGNPDDITLRAIDVLKKVDLVVCEELKEGRRLLNRLSIPTPLDNLNEHNEESRIPVFLEFLKNGKDLALISDAGTPLFEDPGRKFVKHAIEEGIEVKPVPGPSSIMAALVVSGLDFKRFYYYGLLPRKKEDRRRALKKLITFPYPIIFLDTPYRLVQVLHDIKRVFGPGRRVVVACDLTTDDEFIFRGTVKEAWTFFKEHDRKREFVIIVDKRRE